MYMYIHCENLVNTTELVSSYTLDIGLLINIYYYYYYEDKFGDLNVI